MIKTIDNKLHYLKELDFIERELFGLMNPEELYTLISKELGEIYSTRSKSLSGFITDAEVKRIDKAIEVFFSGKLDYATAYIVRGYVVGRLLAQSDQLKIPFKLGIDSLMELPDDIQGVAKEYALSEREIIQLVQLQNKAAVNLSNTTISTIQQVRKTIVESVARREGLEGTYRRLFDMLHDDAGEYNRDWKRVAIYETNRAVQDGYLSLLSEGEWVIGNSMPDACPKCLEMIHNKVYQITKTPPPDYSNIEDPQLYDYLAKLWETKIWEGKSNIGRSLSPRKRINPEIGNKADNLTDRHHHETGMPVIPYHPNCRCTWVSFNPKQQYIDKDGLIRLRVENPAEHKEWIKTHILGME